MIQNFCTFVLYHFPLKKSIGKVTKNGDKIAFCELVMSINYSDKRKNQLLKLLCSEKNILFCFFSLKKRKETFDNKILKGK